MKTLSLKRWKKSLCTQKLKLKEESLHDPFVLPENYQPDVEVVLKTGKMTSETRKAFVPQVAAAMFTKKRHPTHEEFQRVDLDIVRCYTFLESPVPGSTKTVSYNCTLFMDSLNCYCLWVSRINSERPNTRVVYFLL